MNEEIFWQIIEDSRDPSVKNQIKKLGKLLSKLEEREILSFERHVSIFMGELYSHELWGVGYLYWGGCSDDSFMDWRIWVIYSGKNAFLTGRDRPDDLVRFIDASPDAGIEGIGYVPMEILRKKNRKWENASPDFDIPSTASPKGRKWKGMEDLRNMLPKTFLRYADVAETSEHQPEGHVPYQGLDDCMSATNESNSAPEKVVSFFDIALGEPKNFSVKSKNLWINGQKATERHFIQDRKPWWQFW